MSLLQWLTRRGREEILRRTLKEYERMKKFHPTEIVLRALFAGRDVENRKRGTTFRLFNNTKLLVKRTESPPHVKKSWSAADVPLSRFIAMCAEMEPEDLADLSAELGLDEIEKAGGPSALGTEKAS